MEQKEQEKANLTDKDAGASGADRKGVAFDAKASFRYLMASAVVPNIIKYI